MAFLRKPVIYGLKAERLNPAEERFFREEQPAGFILFARNCVDPGQLRALTDSLKALCDGYVPLILIDQEGGRVARLKPPHWRKAPPAGFFAAQSGQNAEKARRLVYLNARLIAAELVAAGINTDCAPLADIPSERCHDIIGDRAYGSTPAQVAFLARAMADGLQDGGILPVLKHIPGHGRAEVDSHESLPVVEASLEELRATDFEPFKALADLPLGMTAHIRYPAIDPEHTATLSSPVIALIRQEIGFGGLLMTDDLSMKALQGDYGGLAVCSLAAGCDLVLHCNGDMAEMQAIGTALDLGDSRLAERLDAMLLSLQSPPATELASIAQEYQDLCEECGMAAA